MTAGKISYFNENVNLKKMANTHVTHRRAWSHPMAARAAGMASEAGGIFRCQNFWQQAKTREG
jgi:hypothetical protein